MLRIIKSKAADKTLEEVAQEFSGYVKLVVDIKREILSAGGERHVDGEELLLKDGSRQEDLWGAGIDLESGEVDFDSMINIRPAQNNPSREVLDQTIRKRAEAIIRKLIR